MLIFNVDIYAMFPLMMMSIWSINKTLLNYIIYIYIYILFDIPLIYLVIKKNELSKASYTCIRHQQIHITQIS